MDFMHLMGLIVIFGVIIGTYPFIKILINWRSESEKNYEKRVKVIEGKIKSIGGKIISIEKTKKVECPYHTEFEDDGSIYVCYRVNYLLEGEQKETWSIFNLRTNIIII